jgi:hypothetical protein
MAPGLTDTTSLPKFTRPKLQHQYLISANIISYPNSLDHIYENSGHKTQSIRTSVLLTLFEVL